MANISIADIDVAGASLLTELTEAELQVTGGGHKRGGCYGGGSGSKSGKGRKGSGSKSGKGRKGSGSKSGKGRCNYGCFH